MTKTVNPRCDEITPSPTNPRKTFNAEKMAELADSIKHNGVLQPVLVRTNPDLSDAIHPYELIAGERRWRASKMAGMIHIPAIVRDDLTTDVIVKLQLIENLQREDLHPLEEAEGYRVMIRDHGYTADTLAAEINRSRSHVFGQLKLLDLCEDGQRLFRAGTINASVALLVARVPTPQLQIKAINDVTRTDYSGETMSVREAARHIQHRYMTRLKDAPFPMDDETLVAGIGTCAACPKRTGNALELYPDIEDKNVCTDPDCFAIKRSAQADRQALNLGEDVPVLTGEDAQKAMPSYYTETRTHVRLDSICSDDPEGRTYRDIIGNDTSGVAMVQHDNTLVAVVQKKAVTEKLKQEGIVTAGQKQRAESRKEKHNLAIANTWRDRLFRKTRELCAMEINAEGNSALVADIMPIIAHTFMTASGYDKGGQVAGLWGALGMDNYTRQQAFLLALPTMKPDDLLLICLDLALIGQRQTDNYTQAPELLLTMARAMEIDPDAELEAVQAEFEAETKQKPGKKAEKPAGILPAKTTSTPSTAALATTSTEGEGAQTTGAAAESAPREDIQSPATAGERVEKPPVTAPQFAIGDTVRIIKGTVDDQLIEYIGKTGTIEQLQHSLLNGRPCMAVVIETGERLTVYEDEIEPQEKAIETDEKPQPAQTFRPGDKVVVIDSAAMNGMTGIVQRIEPDGTLYPCIVLIDGKQNNFFPSQLELVEKSGASEKAIETDEKPQPDQTFRAGDRVQVKAAAKGPAGNKRKCAGKDGTVEILVAASAMPGCEWYAVRFGEATETINLQGHELLLIERPAATNRRPASPYCHPENSDLQWSGRGRKPKWVEAFIAGGGTLEQLKREEIAA